MPAGRCGDSQWSAVLSGRGVPPAEDLHPHRAWRRSVFFGSICRELHAACIHIPQSGHKSPDADCVTLSRVLSIMVVGSCLAGTCRSSQLLVSSMSSVIGLSWSSHQPSSAATPLISRLFGVWTILAGVLRLTFVASPRNWRYTSHA